MAEGRSVPGKGANAAVENPSRDAEKGYWERVSPLGFALPQCAACGKFHFYPKPACPFCGSEQVSPRRASGLGLLYSYSVVHRAPSPAFANDVPYVVAIVATDEGPHLMTRIVDVDPSALAIGLRVQVREGRAGLPPVFERGPSEEKP
jgi:uncharacterized OB-fold protein